MVSKWFWTADSLGVLSYYAVVQYELCSLNVIIHCLIIDINRYCSLVLIPVPLYRHQNLKVMMELISKTRNGMITYCAHCRVYHLEFGNLFFRLSEAGFECLRNYIVSINGPYCERSNGKMTANRKIFLKLPAENVYFCVYRAELEELKALVLLQIPAVEGDDSE